MSDPETLLIRAVTARWYLTEAGRPDLAASIGTNRAGNPMRSHGAYSADDAVLVAQAFVVAYSGERTYTADEMVELVERFQVQLEPLEPVRHWSPRLDDWVGVFDLRDWDGWEGYIEDDEDEIHLFLFVLPAELTPHPDLYAGPDDLIAVETCCIDDAEAQMSAVTPHWVGVLDTWDPEDQEIIDEWADACWLRLSDVAKGSVN